MKFKVGDKVKVLVNRYNNHKNTPQVNEICTIKAFYGNRGVGIVRNGETYDWYVDENQIELVTENMNKKIIGYKLLKDIIEHDAGSIFKWKEATEIHYEGYYTEGDTEYYCTQKDVENTKWFEPVYKEEKIEVKISGNRTVVIDKEKEEAYLLRNKKEYLTFANIKDFYKNINTTVTVGNFNVSIAEITYNVGCQQFTKQDVINVYKAIQ